MKFLIVNADDFGYGAAVNRGIAEAVDRGVVSSVGLMVNTPGTAEAVSMAKARPEISVGLHVNFTNEAQRLVEFDDPPVCRAALREQFDRFCDLMGRKPTHLDSHQHIHRRRPCHPSFLELAQEHGIHLRDQAPVVFKGGFYGQWEYGVSDPAKVSFEALEKILRNELTGGIYELACHPGYFDPEVHYVYHADREAELRTLVDPRTKALLAELGLRSLTYDQLAEALRALADGA
ncbi:MAG TPA: ChbG/HpnK family deacetylase [Vicinamibacteria bacterium]|nr:ChbG/HpnK family deacetylase [Vicinamibacteria bacterium]